MIVFDSSTLILLAKIELLDTFLGSYHGDITIPASVEKESTVKGTFDGLLIRRRLEEGKIKVKESNAEAAKQFMRDFNLGAGEAEAIALALDNKGSIVATDDRNALKACRLLNLEPTTAIAFLLRAREKNLLTKEEALAKLKDLSKYGRYEKTIIAAARNKLNGGNENAKDA